MTPKLAAAKLETLTIELPHRVSFLPLRPVPAGNSLRASAWFFGWRFFVSTDSGPIALAQTLPDGQGGWRLSELHEGPLVAAKQEAFDRLPEELGHTKRPGVSPIEQFDVQLLLAPAARAAVLWVGGEDDATELVLGLEMPGSMMTIGLMPASDFIQTLRRHASSTKGAERAGAAR